MTRRKIIITVAYYASFIAMGISMASLGPTLPGLAQNTGASLGLIGILFTARSFGSLVISSVSGSIYDRLRGHLVMALMIVVMAGLTALTPMVHSIWLLVALLFLTGASQGLLNIGSNTFLVWLHGDEVGPLMNGLHFFFGVGTFIAPIIVAQWISIQGGLTWTYLLLAVIILPTACVAFIPGPTVPKLAHSSQKADLDWGLIILIALIFACYGGIVNTFGGWIYTYVLKLDLANATQAAYLNSIFWGGLTVGRIIAIPLAMRYKPQNLLRVDFLGAFICLVGMLIWPGPLNVIILASAGLGLFIASIYPTTMSMAGQLMPINGKITGYFSIGSSAGMMVVPWIVGQLFVSIGPQSFIFVLISNAVLAFLVLAMLGLRTARKSVVEII
jgi:MFS transporter, FHS family, Na+ dependent glucose transporter 1